MEGKKKSAAKWWIIGGCGCLTFFCLISTVISVIYYQFYKVHKAKNLTQQIEEQNKTLIIDEIPKENTPSTLPQNTYTSPSNLTNTFANTTPQGQEEFDIYVSSVPSKTQIFVNGIIQDSLTPLYLKVKAGQAYKITIQKTGYKKYEAYHSFTKDHPSLNVSLEKKTIKKKYYYKTKKDNSWGGRVY